MGEGQSLKYSIVTRKEEWMRSLAVVFALAGPAAAQDWQPVTEDQVIVDMLADRSVVFDEHTWQWFGSGGDTRFFTERVSDGIWEAQNGQYCSQWPPSGRWDCYGVALRGDEVKFISYNGHESVGTFEN